MSDIDEAYRRVMNSGPNGEEPRVSADREAALDDGLEWDCTHCGGIGECDDNADPLWDCDDNPHPCHACGGTGNRADQRIF